MTSARKPSVVRATHLLASLLLVACLAVTQQAWAALSESIGAPTADGFNGHISNINETAGPGTFDVTFFNSTGSNYAFKRQFCGGDASTYYTAASGQMPNTQGQSTNVAGLTVTLVSGGSHRIYRFSGLPLGSPQNFCFVSADGYRSTTLTSYGSTPTPTITNIRVVDGQNHIPGGRNICVDYSPWGYPSGVNAFAWIENGVVRATGSNTNPGPLWTNYICWDRTSALVEGQSYSVQLRFDGASGSTYSNTLSITVPTTLGDLTGLTASNNDTSIPGQIRLNWNATPGATYYNTWLGTWGPVVNAPTTTALLSTTSTGTPLTLWVQPCNASRCGSWVSTTGIAATHQPPTCGTISAAAGRVPSTTATVRMTINGVARATSITLTAGGQTFDASGGPATWIVDVPLTTGALASTYGTINVTAVANGPGGGTPCTGTSFFRQSPQNASFQGQSIAGETNPPTLTLMVGRPVSYSGTWVNTGQSTWGSLTSHRIGTQAPEGNSHFGRSSIDVPATTAPGASATFTATLTPAATGTYTLQWRPFEHNLEWFGAASAPITVTVVGAPTAATNVQATDGVHADRVRVTWTPGANISAQHVLRAAPGTAFPSGTLTGLPTGWSYACGNLSATASSCDDTTAVPGQTYEYRVFGWSWAAGSQHSGWDFGATSAGDTGFRLAPIAGAPQNFVASTGRVGEIRLTWDAFSGASSFEIERTIPEASVRHPSGTITVTNPAAIQHDDSAVPRGTTRCYRIRAVNAAGPGPWSNEACGWRQGLDPVTLTASKGTVTGATRLTWTTPAGVTPVAQYVHRLVSASNFANWELLASLDGAARSWDDTSPRGADVQSDWYLVLQAQADGSQSYWTMSSTATGGYSANIANGWANLAPTTASATISTTANTPSSPVAPVITDPNTDDSHTVTLPSDLRAPRNGTATISGNRLVYTPASGFSGTDDFEFRVTDRAGATVTGIAQVTVACPSLSIAEMSVGTPLIATDFPITLRYGAVNCHSNLRAEFTIRKADNTVLRQWTVPLANYGATVQQSVPVEALPESGAMQLFVRLRSDQDAADHGVNFTVAPVTPPTLTLRSAQATDYFDAIVRSAANSNCPLTADLEQARADTTLCHVSWHNQTAWPTWLTPMVGSELPSGAVIGAHGIAETGPVDLVMQLSKFDPRGNRHVVAQFTERATIAAAQPMTFGWVTSTVPNVALQSGVLPVTTHFSHITATLQQLAGPNCRIAASSEEAAALLAATPAAAVCTVQLGAPPQGLAPRSGAVGFAGRLLNDGVHQITASVTRHYPRGLRRTLGDTTLTINATAPVIGFDPVPAPRAQYVVGIDSVAVGLRPANRAGFNATCQPTTDQQAALSSYRAASLPLCVFEWVDLPQGLSVATVSGAPGLQGIPSQPGTQTARWRAGLQIDAGSLLPIAEGALTLNVVAPEPPTFRVVGGRRLSDGRYVAQQGLGVAARLEIDASVTAPVDFVLTDSLGRVSTYRRVRAGSARVIEAGNDPLWTTRTITIRAAYSDYPSIATEQTVSVLTVPYDPAIRAGLAVPEAVNDTQTFAATVNIGRFGTGGLQYDPATMGDFEVYLARVAEDGTRVPITGVKRLSTDGEAGRIEFTGLSGYGFLVLKVIAIATVRSPDQAYAVSIESPTRAISVTKGTDIEATVSINRAHGTVPMTPIASVTMDRTNLVALKSIEWLMARGDEPMTVVPRQSGAQFRPTLTEPGTYRIKARLVNKNTNTASDTNEVTVTVYRVPQIAFAGPTYVLKGVPAEVRIQATLPCEPPANTGARCPVPDGLINWTVSGPGIGEPVTGQGSTVTLTAGNRGAITIQAAARAPTSNSDDALAWARERHVLIAADDPKPTVSISGPRLVETGVTNTYTALVSAPWRNLAANAELESEWVLPDGSRVPGSTLSYALPTGTSRATLRHLAWVRGLRERTEVAATLDVNGWTYAVPQFTLRTTQSASAAPASLRAEVVPADPRQLAAMTAYGARFTYQWVIPDGVLNPRHEGSVFTGIARLDGAYPITVRVRDNRGNEQELSQTFTVTSAPPITIQLTPTMSNATGRVPVDVTVRATATGGHPEDRVTEYTWVVNGTPMISTTPGILRFRASEPGRFVVQASAQSRMGVTASASVSVDAVANRPPVCTLNSSVSSFQVVTVIADCRDPDGRIVNYQWRINGQPLGTNANRITFGATGSQSTIEVTATDDSGATTTVTRLVP